MKRSLTIQLALLAASAPRCVTSYTLSNDYAQLERMPTLTPAQRAEGLLLKKPHGPRKRGAGGSLKRW